MRANPILPFAPLLILLATACGGGGGGSTPAPVSISLSPAAASVAIGATQSFQATLGNTSNTAVTWSVQEGAAYGTIDASGLFTAPLVINGSTAAVHVVATSVADSSKSATATVTLNARAYQGTWTVAASPALLRAYGHSLTVLKDGKVLLAGGLLSTPYSITASCEVYDPATGAWTPTASLSTPRRDHTATLLPSGKVLVAGGSPITGGNGFLTSCEVFDPATGTWTATGSMATKRETATANLLPNGKVLVAAGYATTAEVYDPASGTWSAAGDLGQPYLTATRSLMVPDGRVVVPGGSTSGTIVAACSLFSPSTGTTATTGALAEPRAFYQGTGLLSGKALVCGGSYLSGSTYVPRQSAELFDPATGAWSAAASMISPHSFAQSALLSNGRFLVWGGSDSAGAKAEIYDPAANTWTATGNAAGTRMYGAAVTLRDGRVLVVGGNPASAYAELFQ